MWLLWWANSRRVRAWGGGIPAARSSLLPATDYRRRRGHRRARPTRRDTRCSDTTTRAAETRCVDMMWGVGDARYGDDGEVTRSHSREVQVQVLTAAATTTTDVRTQFRPSNEAEVQNRLRPTSPSSLPFTASLYHRDERSSPSLALRAPAASENQRQRQAWTRAVRAEGSGNSACTMQDDGRVHPSRTPSTVPAAPQLPRFAAPFALAFRCFTNRATAAARAAASAACGPSWPRTAPG
jgi:hypothetical protein